MCGICGIYNIKPGLPPSANIIKKMMLRLYHRGPDSCGYYRDKNIALGHTRLAIIDLTSGAQPLSNEDETVWISFNGEIYNYIELTDELKAKGHIFKTKSDTETIVHAYEQWDTDCFQRFNGQWALAIWDKKRHRLILSRDRYGIRPLYYTVVDTKLVFASEIKSIFSYEKVNREIDPAGLNEVFTFWSPVAPRTVFKNINELEPGHFAVIEKNNELKTMPYWQITFPDFDDENSENMSSEEENLRKHLINASKLRFTRSDVPVGSYLSGGIDSSITSAIVTKYTEAPLNTFSIRFSSNEFDEGEYQNEMAERLGTIHKGIKVSPSDIGNIFPDVIWHTERPILRTAPGPLFLLSKLVRESGYKVVVTGEGADEVLAGYDIFREARVRRFIARNPDSQKRAEIIQRLYPWMVRTPGQIPAFAQAFFSKSLDLNDPGLSHRPRWDTTSALKLLLHPDMRAEMEKYNVVQEILAKLPEQHNNWDPLCRDQWLEMRTLLSGYILSAQGDRMLMANSVEGRFPFLDCDFVEFANFLPSRYKLFALQEKFLLKKSFADLIPDSIINRPKQPYRAPDAQCFFNNEKTSWLQDFVSKDILKRAGIFNTNVIEKMLKKCNQVKGENMSNTDNMRIVALFSSMITYHHFIENDGGLNEKEKLPESMLVIEKLSV